MTNARTFPAPISARRERGMTLVEVLVSLLVFSLGLLGLASLQMSGTRYGHVAHLRSVAVSQAQAMADMMRSNEAGAREGAYDTSADGMPAADATVVNCNATDADCSPGELADFHLLRWLHGNAGATPPVPGLTMLLPAGNAVVCLDDTPATWACDGNGSVYAIKVLWSERDIDPNDSLDDVDDGKHEQSVTLLVQPMG